MKEGTFEYAQQVSGASTEIVVNENLLFVTYEATGVRTPLGGQDVSEAPGAVWCVGSCKMADGRHDGHRGMCRTTCAGGTTFAEYRIEGIHGEPTKVTWTFLGGTGRYEGLTGEGEQTGVPLPEPREGRWAATGRG